MAIDISEYRGANLISNRGYCCLYIVGPENGMPIKIGYATNIADRFGVLQGANWKQLLVFDIFWTPGLPVAGHIENKVHAQFEKWRVRGEWFNVRVEKAIRIIRDTTWKLYPNANFWEHDVMLRICRRGGHIKKERYIRVTRWSEKWDQDILTFAKNGGRRHQIT